MKHDFWKLTFLSIGALIASTAWSNAQPNCAPHSKVVERLATAFGESRQSIGLASNNTIVEVFASTETGTWSITATNPNGLTCLVASGQAFEHIAGNSTADREDA